MSKTVKLQESELQTIKEGQDRITQLIYATGNVEVQKSRLLKELEEAQQKQDDYGTILFEKYGQGNISFETGEITLVEEPKTTEEKPDTAE